MQNRLSYTGNVVVAKLKEVDLFCVCVCFLKHTVCFLKRTVWLENIMHLKIGYLLKEMNVHFQLQILKY